MKVNETQLNLLHSVPEQKIIEKYGRSLEHLDQALKVADRAYALDNSGKTSYILLEKRNDGKGYIEVKNYPRWFEKAVVDKN